MVLGVCDESIIGDVAKLVVSRKGTTVTASQRGNIKNTVGRSLMITTHRAQMQWWVALWVWEGRFI